MNVKLSLLTVVLSAAALSCGAVEERVVTSLFQDYVAVQEALASDNLPDARTALKQLAESAEGPVRETALKTAKAEDLAQARSSFAGLSHEVAELDLPKGYIVAFCPMAEDGKGADWVQKEGKIANPYMGPSMSECGTVKKKGK